MKLRLNGPHDGSGTLGQQRGSSRGREIAGGPGKMTFCGDVCDDWLGKRLWCVGLGGDECVVASAAWSLGGHGAAVGLLEGSAECYTP